MPWERCPRQIDPPVKTAVQQGWASFFSFLLKSGLKRWGLDTILPQVFKEQSVLKNTKCLEGGNLGIIYREVIYLLKRGVLGTAIL